MQVFLLFKSHIPSPSCVIHRGGHLVCMNLLSVLQEITGLVFGFKPEHATKEFLSREDSLFRQVPALPFFIKQRESSNQS